MIPAESLKSSAFKRAHVGKFLGLKHIDTSLEGLDKCMMLTRQELISVPRSMGGWSGPKDHRNKTDKFLSVFGVMYVIIKNKKPKGKALKKHILNDIVPRGLDGRIEEIQGKQTMTIKYKPLSLQMKNINRKF